MASASTYGRNNPQAAFEDMLLRKREEQKAFAALFIRTVHKDMHDEIEEKHARKQQLSDPRAEVDCTQLLQLRLEDLLGQRLLRLASGAASCFCSLQGVQQGGNAAKGNAVPAASRNPSEVCLACRWV